MAAFESRIHSLRIEPHPNADRLELAAVGGYRCVVGKGSFTDGDLAAYIPEGSVCPDCSSPSSVSKASWPEAPRTA